MIAKTINRDWYKVADLNELPEDRVMSAKAAHRTVALSHFDGQYAAMDIKCQHQRSPLGEGSIENGVDSQCRIRCSWHGWDLDTLTGKPPGGHDDSGQETYPTEMRADGKGINSASIFTELTKLIPKDVLPQWPILGRNYL